MENTRTQPPPNLWQVHKPPTCKIFAIGYAEVPRLISATPQHEQTIVVLSCFVLVVLLLNMRNYHLALSSVVCRFGLFDIENRIFVTFPSDHLTVPLPNNTYQIYYAPNTSYTSMTLCGVLCSHYIVYILIMGSVELCKYVDSQVKDSFFTITFLQGK